MSCARGRSGSGDLGVGRFSIRVFLDLGIGVQTGGTPVPLSFFCGLALCAEEAAGGGEGVDVFGGFVAALADDSWEAQRKPGIVAGAFADGVEGDFQDDAGLDFEAVAFFGDGY